MINPSQWGKITPVYLSPETSSLQPPSPPIPTPTSDLWFEALRNQSLEREVAKGGWRSGSLERERTDIFLLRKATTSHVPFSFEYNNIKLGLRWDKKCFQSTTSHRSPNLLLLYPKEKGKWDNDENLSPSRGRDHLSPDRFLTTPRTQLPTPISDPW